MITGTYENQFCSLQTVSHTLELPVYFTTKLPGIVHHLVNIYEEAVIRVEED